MEQKTISIELTLEELTHIEATLNRNIIEANKLIKEYENDGERTTTVIIDWLKKEVVTCESIINKIKLY